MTTAERTILEILDRHGPQSFYLLDRRFVHKRTGEVAADALTALLEKRLVAGEDGLYELTQAGRDALSQDAA